MDCTPATWGGGAVGDGEFRFGGEPGGVADLGEGVGGGERADGVDVCEGRCGVGDQVTDLRCEVGDLAVQFADVRDAAAGDVGAGAGVAAEQSHHAPEGLVGGDGADGPAVAAADLLDVAVEAVDVAGARFDQFTAVADEAAQFIELPVAPRRRHVVVAGADAGNHQGVDAAGFGVRALTSAGLGGHLWRHLHDVDACGQQGERSGSPVVA